MQDMQEFVESRGGPRWGRVDSSRDVMEIPCWGVAIFRLEQSRGTRKMKEIFCGI
jgi:hypothetical protein